MANKKWNKHGQKQPSPPGVAKTATEVAPNSRHDPIPALSALYSGEKTDASGLFNIAMAMMGLALGYLIQAMHWVDSLLKTPNPHLYLILLPLPLWLVLVLHSLITLTAMRHGLSVRIIENALFESSDLRVRRNLVGSATGDEIMDINCSALIHKVSTFIVYVGVGLAVLIFTVVALVTAYGAGITGATWTQKTLVMTAGVFYFSIFIVALRSWTVGLRKIDQDHKEIKSV